MSGISPSSAPQSRSDSITLEQAVSRMSDVLTEQQYHHVLELLTDDEDFAVAVRALGNLVTLEVSILAKTATDEDIEGWTTRFSSCFTGIPIPKAQSSSLPGGVEYLVKIHGREDIPAATAMPADLDRVVSQMITVQSMLCGRELKKLHFELRQLLRKNGWLKDALSPIDRAEARAETEVRGTRVK